MAAPRRTREDAARIAEVWLRVRGMVCTCPPNCTDTRWANGPVECAPTCQPCTINAGEKYDPPL